MIGAAKCEGKAGSGSSSGAVRAARLLALALVAAPAGGCMPYYNSGVSESARLSYARCQQGGKACTLKPMTMLVLHDGAPARDFQFGSWVLYDPRPALGEHYIALMNEVNAPICEGYYVSVLVNTVAPITMTCFDREGRGTLRFDGVQQDGNFAGETTGTGLIKTDAETVLFVHGATPEETQRAAFNALWDKYGGSVERPLDRREARVRRVASLPRLRSMANTFAGPVGGAGGNSGNSGAP